MDISSMRWFKVNTAAGYELLNLASCGRIKEDPANPARTIISLNTGVDVTVLETIATVTAQLSPVLNTGDTFGIAL